MLPPNFMLAYQVQHHGDLAKTKPVAAAPACGKTKNTAIGIIGIWFGLQLATLETC
jgi:hypothetical protein